MATSPVLGGSTFRRSIVYGSLATPIKKPEDDHTHRWCVYVRGFNGEDISSYVKSVSFKLHDSFAQPVRTLEEGPFEVNETGWGEFAIQIKIAFQDAVQRPVTLNHHLRLYPPEDLGQLKTSKPVLSEFYDELVRPACCRPANTPGSSSSPRPSRWRRCCGKARSAATRPRGRVTRSVPLMHAPGSANAA